MARAKVTSTVDRFLAALPPDRRREVEEVREVVRRHLPAGYEEAVGKSMLVYEVPLERYSDTYNGQPLWYVALASEKLYLSLHLMRVYGDPAQSQKLKNGFRAAGKKLDMGKACVRFKTADDLPSTSSRNLSPAPPSTAGSKSRRRHAAVANGAGAIVVQWRAGPRPWTYPRPPCWPR